MNKSPKFNKLKKMSNTLEKRRTSRDYADTWFALLKNSEKLLNEFITKWEILRSYKPMILESDKGIISVHGLLVYLKSQDRECVVWDYVSEIKYAIMCIFYRHESIDEHVFRIKNESLLDEFIQSHIPASRTAIDLCNEFLKFFNSLSEKQILHAKSKTRNIGNEILKKLYKEIIQCSYNHFVDAKIPDLNWDENMLIIEDPWDQ